MKKLVPIYAAMLLTPAFAFGVIIVDDNFADGDRAATGPLESDWWASSTSSAIESNAGSVGLVSGSSGRQVHTLFATQTLAASGDYLTATMTFLTPATVAAGGEDLRFGIFDNLGRTSATELGQDTSYASATPNADYSGLFGGMTEIDVESADPASDIQVRTSDPSTSGRLISTTTGFSNQSSSSDIGYAIAANTSYTLEFTVLRNASDQLEYTTTFLGNSHTEIDEAPGSFSFGMAQVGSSSGAFGSENTPGLADNGIDITNFKVEVIPEPATLGLLALSGAVLFATRRMRLR